MTTRFNWCASCGFTLPADDLPPIGATVAAAVVYTNTVNPSYPLPVVRLGIGLRRVSEQHCVAVADGKQIPVSAIVAWMPSSRSTSHRGFPRAAAEACVMAAGVDVWRFRARFTLDAPDGLVRMHDGHDDGHHLLAVRAGSQAAAALVADAAACGGHASGLPADQAVPYFVEVWPPVLATILQTPASRLRWLFVDAAGGLRDVSAAQDRDGPGQRQSLRAMLAHVDVLDPELRAAFWSLLDDDLQPWAPLASNDLKQPLDGADWLA